MDFYEVINSRHSIRDFADESIPKDILESKLEKFQVRG